MKMVSKYGNVIMNANTKAEQERLRSLGYNELEKDADERICDDSKTEQSSENVNDNDSKTEQSSENVNDNPSANNNADKKATAKTTAEK